jgi:hypothetical protein
MKLLVVLETMAETNTSDICYRNGDIVYFTEGTDRYATVCGLDVWHVCDAYDSLGYWRRVEALHDNNICALRCCVSCLWVCVMFLYFSILNDS